MSSLSFCGGCLLEREWPWLWLRSCLLVHIQEVAVLCILFMHICGCRLIHSPCMCVPCSIAVPSLPDPRIPFTPAVPRAYSSWRDLLHVVRAFALRRGSGCCLCNRVRCF